jgi:hypothetical protein
MPPRQATKGRTAPKIVRTATPPPIKPGTAGEVLRRIHPQHTLTLDAGVFDWLWRIVGERHRVAHERYEGNPDFADYLDMVDRAMETFDGSVTGLHERVARVKSPPPEVARKVQRLASDAPRRKISRR